MEQRKSLQTKQVIAVGSLLFGMLFGAGNVIFPPIMGQKAGESYVPSAVGFLVTAVGLPILAIISFALSKKLTLKDYADRVGKGFGMFFSLALLLTIGPLFAIPRTATVAFEVGIQPLLEGKSPFVYLLIYSVIFFVLCLFFSIKPSKILDIVGKAMAPAFIVLIAVLLLANIFNPMGNPSDYTAQGAYAKMSFSQGIIDGYQTMDILACLAFGITIITNIKMLGVQDEKFIAKETGKSSIFTLIVMSLIYFGLTYLGATSLGAMEVQPNGGLILAYASYFHFGGVGQFLLALTITIACLKTAIGLCVSLSQSFAKLFPNKLKEKTWTVIFVAASFTIANFGLNTIIQLSLPVLMFLYPISITLILLWLVDSVIPLRDIAFKVTIILAIIPALFDLLGATPDSISKAAWAQNVLDLPKGILPLYGYGLGWLVPVGIGLVISLLFFRAKRTEQV